MDMVITGLLTNFVNEISPFWGFFLYKSFPQVEGLTIVKKFATIPHMNKFECIRYKSDLKEAIQTWHQLNKEEQNELTVRLAKRMNIIGLKKGLDLRSELAREMVAELLKKKGFIGLYLYGLEKGS